MRNSIKTIGVSILVALILFAAFYVVDPLHFFKGGDGSEVETVDSVDNDSESEEVDSTDLPDLPDPNESTNTEASESDSLIEPSDDNDDPTDENSSLEVKAQGSADSGIPFKQPKTEVDPALGFVNEEPAEQLQIPANRKGIDLGEAGKIEEEDRNRLISKYDDLVGLSMQVSFLPSAAAGFTSDPHKSSIGRMPNPMYAIVLREDLSVVIAHEIEKRINPNYVEAYDYSVVPNSSYGEGNLISLEIEPVGNEEVASFRIRYKVLFVKEQGFQEVEDYFLLTASPKEGLKCEEKQS